MPKTTRVYRVRIKVDFPQHMDTYLLYYVILFSIGECPVPLDIELFEELKNDKLNQMSVVYNKTKVLKFCEKYLGCRNGNN